MVNIASGTTISHEASQILSQAGGTNLQSRSSISQRSSTSRKAAGHVYKINMMERNRKRSQLNKHKQFDFSRNTSEN